jgi:Bacterial SH3 domain
MGQPKKFTSDVIGLSGKYPTGVLENPEPIAQRFAHSSDLRRTGRRVADPPRVPRSTAPSFATREQTPSSAQFTRRTRWLIAGLVSAAWVPCVILGGMWFGSTGGMAPPTAQTPEPQSMAPHAVLTASTRIDAKAGDTVGFPIALDGTDGVPSRSVIAIEGLPQASNLSEGRPYGESDWMLKPDQIGDLQLVLPRSTTIGEFRVVIALIAPDENIIARAETILTIAPAPSPLEPVMAEDSDEAAALPGGEVASLDAGSGDETQPDATPETTETATAPSTSATPEGGEQTQEAATPASGAQPNMLGQAEPEESALPTVQPSVAVNMREAPKSSSPVLGVVGEGIELQILERKRGWVKVTDPASGKEGWIYGGLLAGEAKKNHRIRRVAPNSSSEPKSESFWGRVGRWLTPG